MAAAMPYAARADTIIDGGQTVTYPPSPPAFSDALTIGKVGNGTVNVNSGATLQMNTVDGSTNSRIELGNGAGSTGTLNINGGTVTVNIAAGTAPAGTSIGRIWVGGGLNNTTGGTGTVNMSSGLVEFVSASTPNTNYGGLAIGRGTGVTGNFNQSGGTVRMSSGSAVDLGTQGGTGTYTLSQNAVFDAGHGGMTMYVGSRTASGTLEIKDNAQFTATSGPNPGGQLYVGDANATGLIKQSGSSVVTLGLLNPILFGSNVSNVSSNTSSGTTISRAGRSMSSTTAAPPGWNSGPSPAAAAPSTSAAAGQCRHQHPRRERRRLDRHDQPERRGRSRLRTVRSCSLEAAPARTT